MLDHHANQASGLQRLGVPLGPRLLAVVNHGDEQAELPLLWQLCLALVSYGYAITVLDASTQETDSNPGLLDLLDNTQWHDTVKRDNPAWLVLPAHKGIQSLCTLHSSGIQSMQKLRHLFPQEVVVILYCKVESMIPLISGTGIEPLLAVSQTRTSLISSYLALKRLLITGKLKPTIVNLIHELSPETPEQAHQPIASLTECAKKFLGQDVRAISIVEQFCEEKQNDDIQQLALRLMESALPLMTIDAPFTVNSGMSHFGQIDHFAGSH